MLSSLQEPQEGVFVIHTFLNIKGLIYFALVDSDTLKFTAIVDRP